MSTLLSATSITFAYADRPVLREAAVSLEAGQVVALLGPNGSGKSTLIRVLLGHLHGSGSILWDGRDVQTWGRRELARYVAYLPQSPTFEADHRVIDVLRLGRAPYLKPFGVESSHDLAVVSRVAGELELTDILDRRMDRLSGGQRQRVFVGRCLVQEPRAMLLDEPNTFLDLKHQIELGKLLRQLARQQRIGVVMASHDLNLSATFADTLVLLREGAVVRAGTPSDVLDPGLIADVYGVAMDRIDRPGTPLVVPRID